jgi:molecular chaperone GrpE
MQSSRVNEQEQHGGAEPQARDQSQATDEDLAAELARIEDLYKRALADLDNYRKRAGREVDRRATEVRDALLRDWLEVLDSIERALRMQPEGQLQQGLRAVLDQIEAVLARHGVQRMGNAGEPFDPERHEAIEVRTNDEFEQGTVLEVARSGFAVGDRVLRPAQVVVSRRSQANQ